MEIQMGMYVLPQARILANKLLKICLNTKGYCYQCQHTPGLWRDVCDIMFCLIIVIYAVKTTSIKHMAHHKNFLKEHYTVVHGKAHSSAVST